MMDEAGMESVEFDDVDLNNTAHETANILVNKGEPRTVRWKRYLQLDDRKGDASTLAFQQLVEQYPLPELPDATASNVEQQPDLESKTNTDTHNSHLDPLTAMVQQAETQQKKDSELERAYRKEKALRKRTGGKHHVVEEEVEDDALANASMIQKDLHRLSVPGPGCFEERNTVLETLLFVFCSVNHNYLQGMHEVASYVLYAFELEFASHKDKLPAAEIYFVLERLLRSLYVSYDIGDNHPQAQMSRRMMTTLTQLWPALQPKMQNVPLQLILTKWMRLLFAREVSNVLETWDAIFQAAHALDQQVQDNGNNNDTARTSSVQRAAEAFGIARLWEHGNTILYLDDNLHWLMNMPVEVNVTVLVKRMRFILGLSQEPLPLPGPVPPAIVAEQQQHIQQKIYEQQALQPQATKMTTSPTARRHTHSSSNNPPNLWGQSLLSQTTGMLGSTNLSGITEKISKRISQEWDQLIIPDRPHQRQQPPPQQAPSNNDTYNLDYYSDTPRRVPDSPRAATSVAAAAPTNVGSSISNQMAARNSTPATPKPYHTCTRSQQLQRNLHVLQQFAVQCERTHGIKAPGTVWGALAELQVLQQQLDKEEKEATPR